MASYSQMMKKSKNKFTLGVDQPQTVLTISMYQEQAQEPDNAAEPRYQDL